MDGLVDKNRFGYTFAYETPEGDGVTPDIESTPEQNQYGYSFAYEPAEPLPPEPEPEKPKSLWERTKEFAKHSVLDQLIGSYYDTGATWEKGTVVEKGAAAGAAMRGERPDSLATNRTALRTGFMPKQEPMNLEQRQALAKKNEAEAREAFARWQVFQKRGEEIPQSKETTDFLNDNSDLSVWEAFKKAPAKIIVEIGARSAVGSLHGVATGVAVGAPLGLVSGPGGAAAGFAAGMGASSARQEYASSLMDGLQREGVDVKNVDAIIKATANKELMDRAQKYATIRAAVVGGVDGLSGLVGGKQFAPGIANKLARELVNAGIQMPIQAGLGAAGEAGGQLAATGKITSGRQIAAEAAGELVTAPIEVAGAAYAGSRPDVEVAPTPAKSPLDLLHEKAQAARESTAAAGGDALEQELAAAKVALEGQIETTATARELSKAGDALQQELEDGAQITEMSRSKRQAILAGRAYEDATAAATAATAGEAEAQAVRQAAFDKIEADTVASLGEVQGERRNAAFDMHEAAAANQKERDFAAAERQRQLEIGAQGIAVEAANPPAVAPTLADVMPTEVRNLAARRAEIAAATAADEARPEEPAPVAPSVDKYSPEGLSDRIKNDAEHRAYLLDLSSRAGWMEKGGKLLTQGTFEDTIGGGPNVVGKTKWLPSEPWWSERPNDITPKYLDNALKKAIAGKKLTAKQHEAVKFLSMTADERRSPVNPDAQEPMFTEAERAELTGRTTADINAAAHEAATSPQNDLPEPTEAQKAAGNYKKGHINIAGIGISVENPVGSTRTFVRDDGSKGESTLKDHYGYIKRTEGADDEHTDVFVNPEMKAAPSTAEFPKAGELVDGREVGTEVPNLGSISASLTDYTEQPGIREVPMSAFTEAGPLGKLDERTRNLAADIKETQHIKPLIVVMDKEGPYILEGGHRFDALRSIGAKSFPAVVVQDNESIDSGADAGPVYVIDQINQTTGAFDEHKVMMGYPNQLAATRAYLRNYEKGHKVGPVTELSTAEFKDWVKNGDLKAPMRPIRERAQTPRSIEGERVETKKDRPGRKGMRGEPMARAAEQPTVSNFTHGDAVAAVSPLLKAMPGLNATILTDSSQLPAARKAEMMEHGQDALFRTAKGLYFPSTNEIFIFSAKHKSAEDIVATTLHEGVAHYGLRALLGDDLHGQLMRQVYASLTPAVREEIAKTSFRDVNDAEDQMVIADEYIASLAEKSDTPSILQKIIDAVRDTLRRVGVVKNWTDNDIKALLRESRKALQGKPLDQVKVVTEAEIAETGEVVDLEQRADIAIRQIQKRQNMVNKLKECMA